MEIDNLVGIRQKNIKVENVEETPIHKEEKADLGFRLQLKLITGLGMALSNKCDKKCPAIEPTKISKEENILALSDDHQIDGESSKFPMIFRGNRRLLNCQFCNFSCPSELPERLRKHMLKFHKEKKGNCCSICGKVFARPAFLIVHIRIHTGETPFQCKLCGRRFNVVGSLRRHNSSGCCKKLNEKAVPQEAIEEGPSGISLSTKLHDTFPKEAKFQFNSQVSIKTYLDATEKRHLLSCKIVLTRCDNLVSSLRDKAARVTVRPSITHYFKKVIIKGKKLFQCNVCRKTFGKLQATINHCRIHTNDRPFKCPICFRAFRNRKSLHFHSRVHLREEDKPFRCEVCSKTFIAKAGLVDHVNMHFGVRQHECKICHKTFIFRSSLCRHNKMKHQ